MASPSMSWALLPKGGFIELRLRGENARSLISHHARATCRKLLVTNPSFSDEFLKL